MDSKKIFLNQNGNFCFSKDLRKDNGIEPAYKDLFNKFNYDIRAELVHPDLDVLNFIDRKSGNSYIKS